MKQEVKEEKKENKIENKIAGGYIGRYALSFSNKLYSFEFPIDNTLEENSLAISYIKEEIEKAIVTKNEQEKAKKETK